MSLIRRIRYLFRQRRHARELADEIELHRSLTEDARRGEGLSAEEAQVQARRAMGNATLAREHARGVWVAAWIESVLQDLRYALRSLASQPGFTAMALIALVLGIGLNVSLFTVFRAVALRPWPVDDLSRVVSLWQFAPWAQGYSGFSTPEFQFLARNATTLEGAFLQVSVSVSQEPGADASRGGAQFVSGDYFRALGVPMRLGRAFGAEEDVLGNPAAVIVLSHRVWNARFAADPGVVGQQMRLNGVPFTIIGVAPPEFTGTSQLASDLWAPLSSLALARPNDESTMDMLTDPNRCCSDAGARVKRGVTRAQAEAELEALSAQFRATVHKNPVDIRLEDTTLMARPGPDTARIAQVSRLLFGALGSILLLACANVCNLMLARSTARQREIAVRVAIGAGRARVIRQLLTESLLLAGFAAACSVALAAFLPRFALQRFMPELATSRLSPDPAVLAYAIGLAVLSALVFGLAPALRATRVSVSDTMKRNSAQGGQRIPLRSVLLGVQVAISVVLLTGAGLLVRAISHARSLDMGFRTEGISVVSAETPGSSGNADVAEARLRRMGDIQAEVRAAAGGEPVALAMYAPLAQASNTVGFTLPGQKFNHEQRANVQWVDADYFRVLEMPLIEGRNFLPEDSGRGAMIVNQTMARRYWPGRSAVGQRLEANGPREIVGVVRDARLRGTGPVEPTYFEMLSTRFARRSAVLILPERAVPAASAVIGRMEPQARVQSMPLASGLDPWLEATKTGLRVAAALGGLALALAITGIYGVVSYSVEQKRREIGVRMALGASPGEVASLILRRNGWALLGGACVGLALAAAGSRVIESLLQGMSAADPLAYLGVLIAMLMAGAAASLIPALRAARIDPVTALRQD